MKYFVLCMVAFVAVQSSVVVEERGIFEDLHIDETLIDLIIDTVKTIDFKEVIKYAKMLICGGDELLEVESDKLEFSFETHKQLVRIARRLLCGRED